MSHRFQVNLSGIIALLSNHLYSSPAVFIRELLQNGTDAIHARQLVEPGFVQPRIEMELASDGAQLTLIFTDNGVGLTEDEIHTFLATIGESSKRDALGAAREEFIGQFGIGLLSAFLVSDEVVIITQSAKAGSKPMEWRGKPDGTYNVRELKPGYSIGTRVYLRCKSGAAEWFHPDKIRELALHFGGLLPIPVSLSVGGKMSLLNAAPPPWKKIYGSVRDERTAYLAYGRESFGEDFLDALAIRSEAGDVEGVAFVLPYSPSPSAKAQHRVYLKHMLLSEMGDGLLPEWAFFVRVIVNANALRPNAAREAFYEDSTLEKARESLGLALQTYLKNLAATDPQRLTILMSVHHMAMRALALHDDEFCRLIIDHVPFQTNQGYMTLGEYRKEHKVVRYVPTVDLFRQIAAVAASHNLCIINAGHSYEEELLRRLPKLFANSELEAVGANSLSQYFSAPTLAEQQAAFEFIRLANTVLQPFQCAVEFAKFEPAEMPVLFTTNTDARFRRTFEQTRDMAGSAFGGILDSVVGNTDGPHSRLFFNCGNPLVKTFAALTDRTLQRRTIELLYVQALMLGHHPLSSREMGLMNNGLAELLQFAVQRSKGESS